MRPDLPDPTFENEPIIEIDGMSREELATLKTTLEADLAKAEKALVLEHAIPAWDMTKRVGHRLRLQRLLYAVQVKRA